MDGTGGTNPHWGALGITNIMLEFRSGGTGHLEGFVTTGTDEIPIADVELNITGTDRSVFTTANGYYFFEYLPIGPINISVQR